MNLTLKIMIFSALISSAHFTKAMEATEQECINAISIKLCGTMAVMAPIVNSLTPEEMGFLEKDQYPSHKEETCKVLTKVANLAYPQLVLSKLEDRPLEEYVETFVAAAIKERYSNTQS